MMSWKCGLVLAAAAILPPTHAQADRLSDLIEKSFSPDTFDPSVLSDDLVGYATVGKDTVILRKPQITDIMARARQSKVQVRIDSYKETSRVKFGPYTAMSYVITLTESKDRYRKTIEYTCYDVWMDAQASPLVVFGASDERIISDDKVTPK